MYLEVGILIGIVGCFVGLAGWLKSRDSKISNDAEWKGTVNTKLDIAIGIRKDYEKLETTVDEHGKKLVELDASTKSAHKRLDDIERRTK